MRRDDIVQEITETRKHYPNERSNRDNEMSILWRVNLHPQIYAIVSTRKHGKGDVSRQTTVLSGGEMFIKEIVSVWDYMYFLAMFVK